MDKNSNARRKLFTSLALAGVILVSFWPVIRCAFLNYDDPDYVTENPQVQMALALRSIAWAFTTGHASNRHPVTCRE